MSILIIGEAPAKVGTGSILDGSSKSGSRIQRWISGFSTHVRTMNLLNFPIPGGWTSELRTAARVTAASVTHDGLVVLLGRNVAAAFGIGSAPYYNESVKTGFVVVPHPSGRSRYWNDPVHRTQADDWWAGLRQRTAEQTEVPA